MTDTEVRALILTQGGALFRDMPWRQDISAYSVLVSEIMLQQTQVERVRVKYDEFMKKFPTIIQLAEASLADVLKVWQGLGYNRRAKYLHETAKIVTKYHAGSIPNTYDELIHLPGIGPNTAGAICAYAYNHPAIFIETNIRTVLIHHCFADKITVDDKQIKLKLEQLIDRQHPREFYWALMDYGSWLKQSGVKNNQRSKHYKKQTPLKGSVREVRGHIIRELVTSPLSFGQLRKQCDKKDGRFEIAFAQLLDEKLIQDTGKIVHLTK